MKFYKLDPADFMGGVEGMSLKEIGAYIMLLNAMYLKGGAIADSAAGICGMLNIERRAWLSLRASLIRKGKIIDTGDGHLSNRRVEEELQNFAELCGKRKKAALIGGKKSAEKRANSLKNKDDAQPIGQPIGQPKSKQIETIEEDTSLRSVSNSSSLRSDESQRCEDETNVVALRPPAPVAEAIEAYNRVAEAQGWRRCREITKARRAAVTARLRQRGLDGWTAALAIAARTRWINEPDSRPTGHRTWKPNIDWFSRDKTFVDLFESEDAAAMPELETADVWKKRLAYLGKFGEWESRRWGPAPGEAGCRVPGELLADLKGQRK